MFGGRRPARVRVIQMCGLLAVGLALGWTRVAPAQSNTRLLLSSGWGVPEHAGFVFGPFSNLAMNEAKEIVFLSSLRGSKSELRAVIRSTGVTFSVVAFEGLRSPVPRSSYESFSAPSLNDSGLIAFTAVVKGEVPASAVIRLEGTSARAIATSGGGVPGIPDATFLEFSAPVINSTGNILFGARLGGKNPATGLFLWTPQGIRSVPLPADMGLTPNDLLKPVLVSPDEAAFVPPGVSSEDVAAQFFRAVATKNFQELKPPPGLSEAVEVLAAHPNEKPVRILLVLMEGDRVETALLVGDPSQPVMARRSPGTPLSPLGRIQGQTVDARGNIIVVAAPAGQDSDLAIYCFRDGQVIRLTSPEEFLPITEAARGKSIASLAGDGQHTIALIAPGGEGGDSSAIYVTSLP